jgi:hypothetical protein
MAERLTPIFFELLLIDFLFFIIDFFCLFVWGDSIGSAVRAARAFSKKRP